MLFYWFAEQRQQRLCDATRPQPRPRSGRRGPPLLAVVKAQKLVVHQLFLAFFRVVARGLVHELVVEVAQHVRPRLHRLEGRLHPPVLGRRPVHLPEEAVLAQRGPVLPRPAAQPRARVHLEQVLDQVARVRGQALGARVPAGQDGRAVLLLAAALGVEGRVARVQLEDKAPELPEVRRQAVPLARQRLGGHVDLRPAESGRAPAAAQHLGES
mmetsp:Transcript_42920/g.67099  ORF Transcript_42920/g.67099 Transcript_42920/m.67099 type:complete len:213 (+) Transcript_42920:355-993(+)